MGGGGGVDLARVGAAYAAGEITRAHLDVAVGVHRRLRAAVREQAMPVTDPVTGEVREERCIRVVDAALARHARGYTVPEFTRIADRIVHDLDPPRPGDAHRRRYLHLSRLPDGSLLGRFACGPAQALTLTTVLAALAGPRPGKAIDADGVERDLPDERTPAERRMDALVEAIDHNHRTCHCRHTHTHRRATGSGPDSEAESQHRQAMGRTPPVTSAPRRGDGANVHDGDTDRTLTPKLMQELTQELIRNCRNR